MTVLTRYIQCLNPLGLTLAIGIACATFSGCSFTITDGYVFTYEGEKVEKSESGSIEGDIQIIEIENQFGQVQVDERGGSGEWAWSAACWAATADEASEFLDQLKIEVTTDGNRQMWKVVLPESDWNLQGVESNLVIHPPKNCEIRSVNRHGDTNLSGLTGTSDVENSHGNLEASQLTGSTKLTGRHGNVKISQLGASGQIDVEHGDFTLTESLDEIELSVRHGDTKIVQAAGGLNIDSKHGELQIESSGPNVQCVSKHGDVELTYTGSNPTQLELETAHGDITLNWGSTVAPNVVLSTSHGQATSKIRSEADGPKVLLDTRHGDILVREK